MAWRDTLVAQLTSTLRVEPASVPGAVKVSMSWPKGDIDLPEVCNHLARKFKMKSVTVIRRTTPGRLETGSQHSAILRFSNLEESEVAALLKTFSNDLHGLALAIVSSGT